MDSGGTVEHTRMEPEGPLGHRSTASTAHRTQFSWYRPHLETSLELIERVAPGRSASIIDVGSGESTLVDDLLVHGYSNLTVLDISQVAVDKTKERLGSASEHVCWLVGDVTTATLEPSADDLNWSGRADLTCRTARASDSHPRRALIRRAFRFAAARQSTFWGASWVGTPHL